MKKCKYCQSEIDQKAKVCPKCGKKQGNFFQKHPVLTVFLALILFCLVFLMALPSIAADSVINSVLISKSKEKLDGYELSIDSTYHTHFTNFT